MLNTKGMRIKLVAIAVICTLTLAPLSNAFGSMGKISNNVKVTKDFIFMTDLLGALRSDGVNCTSYAKNTSGVLGVREEGTCKVNNQVITIDIFPDSKSAKAIITAVKSLAGGYIIGSNNWALFLNDATLSLIHI